MKTHVIFQRIENAALFVVAAIFYGQISGNWLLFILGLFVFDVSLIGYLHNPKSGAYVYNSVHSLVVPVILVGLNRFTLIPQLDLLALLWIAHVGLDRALGYGLKSPSGFSDTHLGKIGKK